jgi:hypothetical protein
MAMGSGRFLWRKFGGVVTGFEDKNKFGVATANGEMLRFPGHKESL